MSSFKTLQLLQRNTKQIHAGFWSVTSLNSHRVVSNIVKLTNGSYGTSHDMQSHKTFMGALASLIPLFVKTVSKAGVIRNMVIGAILAVSAVAGSAHANVTQFKAMNKQGEAVTIGMRSTAQGESGIHLEMNGSSYDLEPSDAGEWQTFGDQRAFITHWHSTKKGSDIADLKLVEMKDSQVAFLGLKLKGADQYYSFPVTEIDGYPSEEGK